MRITIIIISTIIGFFVAVLLFFAVWFIMKYPILRCSCKKELKETIRQMFDADSVSLRSGFVPMGSFPNIKTISVSIVNGTTNTIDFKSLPAKSLNLEAIDQIEEAIKKEIEPVARLLFERCNSEKFNNIAVYFCKYDNEGRLIILYQYHFGEMATRWLEAPAGADVAVVQLKNRK